MSQPLAEETPPPHAGHATTLSPHALDRIQYALRGLRYGEVTVIVQDGVVVQVERTEKLRLRRRGGD